MKLIFFLKLPRNEQNINFITGLGMPDSNRTFKIKIMLRWTHCKIYGLFDSSAVLTFKTL